MGLERKRFPQTYKDAGVDIRAADGVVRRIRRSARSTFSKEVLSQIGSFGAFYDARFRGYKNPVLVSSIDGVGTKLKIAARMGEHSIVGEDLVNHCVNDILVCGARPLFFLDYIGIGKLSPTVTSAILRGIVKACKENHCSLVGGETAEMPGVYTDGEYDLVGAIVGIAERDNLLDGKKVRAGDQILALSSTGLHTNGYSLARRVLLAKYRLAQWIDALGSTVGEALLAVHRSYLKPISVQSRSVDIHAMAHITGGGIEGNTTRVLPKGPSLRIDWKAWDRPPIYSLIQKVGNVPESDMRRTFNLGVGLVIILSNRAVDKCMATLRKLGERPFIIGEVEKKG